MTYSSSQHSAETLGNKPTSRVVVKMRIEVLVRAEVRPSDGPTDGA